MRINISDETEQLLESLKTDIRVMEKNLRGKRMNYRKIGTGLSNDLIIRRALLSLAREDVTVPVGSNLQDTADSMVEEGLHKSRAKRREEAAFQESYEDLP